MHIEAFPSWPLCNKHFTNIAVKRIFLLNRALKSKQPPQRLLVGEHKYWLNVQHNAYSLRATYTHTAFIQYLLRITVVIIIIVAFNDVILYKHAKA